MTKMGTNRGRVLLLAPQLYGTYGGIPAYMQRLVEICAECCSEYGGLLTCLTMHTGETGTLALPPMTHVSQGGKIAYSFRAAHIARTQKPTLVIVGHLGLAPVALLLKSVGLIDRYIVVLHGIEAWKRVDRADRIAARKATALIATTNYTATEFAKWNTGNDREPPMQVIPLGLGSDDLPPFSSPPAIPGELRVLMVGRLWASERYKGVDTLVEAVSEVKKAGLRIQLTVVGEGDDLPHLKQAAKELGVDERVCFRGSVSDAELEVCYRECDIFAMPSKKEGFGIVFLEAMRWGKPCIGGNHGGTPEVIDHGVNGYLVEHGNIAQLVDCLRTLALDPELRQRMGSNARQKIAAGYLAHHLRQRWRAVLTEMLSTRVGEVPEEVRTLA